MDSRRRMEIKSFFRNRLGLIVGLLTAFVVSVQATNHLVTINNFFSPQTQYVNVGDSVTWENLDDFLPHSSTSDTSLWDTGWLDTEQYSGAVVFNSPGTFPYYDSVLGFAGTIIVVAAVNSPPSVSITNPVNNAVFSAPANIKIEATASDTDGSISSVEFFNGATSLGVTTGPFSVTMSNVAVGAYTLTAKATDNLNATTTSSAITVTVTSIGLNSARILNKQFQFGATGLVSGKTNLLQASTNLSSPANWISIATNVAPNIAPFIDTKSSNFVSRFYRVVQLP